MYDECLVLLPCSTLEDFPRQTSETYARGLLAAWTGAWHPRLLAAIGKLPQWGRADTLPPTLANRLLIVPEASQRRLPNHFDQQAAAAEGCRVLAENDRRRLVAAMAECFDQSPQDWSSQGGQERPAADDFFALGYTWLQIQLMTRRLRYTSNLDELYFSGRVIAAARALVEDRREDAISGLHDAFDCLAEERDHYFSSDPHLVDLTLLAATTLDQSLAETLAGVDAADSPPINFLLDTSLISQVVEQAGDNGSPSARLLALARAGRVGLAGGGPDETVNLHHQTVAEAERSILRARAAACQQLGLDLRVYARTSGETPGDAGPALARAGFRGAIPIDLAAGSGWRDESKLIWQSGDGGDLDALVAKPIDASGAAGLLALGPNLGQAIDSGEIATALLVHWPGQQSDTYADLRRAAGWGLALGRFWKLEEYFSEGERPFHHYRGRADEGAGDWLTRQVASGRPDPLSSAGRAYRRQVTSEAVAAIDAMTTIASGRLPDGTNVGHLDDAPAALEQAAGQLCVALGGELEAATHGQGSEPVAPRQRFLVNPHSIGLRANVRMAGGPPAAVLSKIGRRGSRSAGGPQLFAWTRGDGGHCDVAVDVAGGGFCFLDGSHPPPRRRWLQRRSRLAVGNRLVNEFMEVEISPDSGGVMGVYSGTQRGNRYSMRLAYCEPATTAQSDGQATDRMVADSVRVGRSDEACGEIIARGRLVDAAGQPVASYETLYRLGRGSRWLETLTSLEPAPQLKLGEDPWQSYIAWRTAVAADATALGVPLRDRLHRLSGRRRIDAPAGLMIDEVDRQTLLDADGRPSYRRVGDRFVDALLVVRRERQQRFAMAVGFDVPAPLAALRGRAAPPPSTACRGGPATPAGWLVHCGTADVLLVDLRVESTGPLVLSMIVVATTSESRTAQLRFCRDVAGAEVRPENAVSTWNAATCQGDRVELPLAGHEAAALRVHLVD